MCLYGLCLTALDANYFITDIYPKTENSCGSGITVVIVVQGENMKSYKCLPGYARIEIVAISVNNIAYAILGVCIAKAQGLVFTATMIGLLIVAVKLGSILVCYAKSVEMSTKYRFAVLFEGFSAVAALSFLWIPVWWWLVIIAALSTAERLLISVFFTDYDTMLKRVLSTAQFRDMNYLEMIVYPAGSLLGASIGMLLVYLYMTGGLYSLDGMVVSTTVGGVVLVVSCLIRCWQYTAVYSDVRLSKILDENIDAVDIDSFK